MSKQKLKTILQNPFFQGSAVMFIGAFAVNVLSYLFNVLVGQQLGRVAFGEFSALISIVYLVSVVSSVFATIVVKYTAISVARNQYSRIRDLLVMMTRYSSVIVIAFFIVSLLFSNQILSALKIDDLLLLILLNGIFSIMLPQAILNAGLQGLEKFVTINLYGGILVIIRIIVSLLLIWAGLGIAGVFWAMIISSIVVYILSWFSIENTIQKAEIKLNTLPNKIRNFFRRIFSRTDKQLYELRREIIHFSPYSTLTALGTALLVQNDIILAKVFFSPEEAGTYASLALICKVIPFFTLPLVTVMFPQLTKLVEQKKNFLPFFGVVLAIVIGCSAAITAMYMLLPSFVVHLFSFGKDTFSSAIPYIGLFSLFQLCYAVLNTFVTFFLSIGKNNHAGAIILAGIAQAIGFTLFHQSLQEFISVSIIICLAFILWYSAITVRYYLNYNKR